ncbi:MAG: caspase family protein [Pseudorhodoplanes sp.]|nr:caspase family protein [Pseudorhodoplanes sp.]
MPRGLSLHIGLNELDPNHYAGWRGKLNACEADARDMQDIAQACGYEHHILLTPQATRAALTSFLANAAASLRAGDILLLTYSGHGGQLPDLNGDEPDDVDETWCMYDGQISDDELYSHYGRFAPGVRVLVLSDSCHSGSVTKQVVNWALLSLPVMASIEFRPLTEGSITPKYLPPEVALHTYNSNRKFYDELLRSAQAEKAADGTVKACVRLISGCQDNQYSLDGTFNSAFTARLLRVWNDGRFSGNYHDFHVAILADMPPTQSPKHFVIGPSMPDYDRQKPFTI